MSLRTTIRNIDWLAYRVGSRAPESGFYVCIPCGNKRYFKLGSRFPSCLSCFDKKERRSLRKGLEFWERVFDIPSPKHSLTKIH